MTYNLSLLRVAGDITSHAALRHNVIAENIANSDTPGYKAKEVSEFANLARSGFSGKFKSTRPLHISSDGAGVNAKVTSDKSQIASPNGNSVSLETEMIRMAENRQEFDRALTVYKSAIGILRTSVGRG